MNFLAVDHGLSHVGLAFSHSSLAEPLKTVTTSEAIDAIKELVESHHIDAVIVGISENQMAVRQKAFADKLGQSLNVPVTLHDETLTSVQAKQKLSHAKKKVRSGHDHHYAAALILQDYLDYNSPRP